jgi:hypothetical protein
MLPDIPFHNIKTPVFGPSGVRALPLAAGINVGGHYTWNYFSSPFFFFFFLRSLLYYQKEGS